LIAPFQWKRLKTDPKAAGRIARIIGIGLLVIWVLSTVGSLFYLQTLANAPMPVFAVERSIEIEASPAVVWEVLMDFEAYPDWNPYAVGIEGIAEPGEVISLTIVQGNWDEPRTVKPKLVSVESQKKLAWHGTTMMTGLLETDHYFELTELGAGRTRLRQVEEFRGWIARTMNDENRRHTGASFEAMNEALAKRAEGVKR
jgi:hypothetical protein